MSYSITVYTGQAGTGKTTKLISHLSEQVKLNDFQDYHSVLAITFMHGSRRRLNSKLKFIKREFGANFKCATIDSFVVSTLNRFRTYLNIEKIISCNIENDETIEINNSEILMPLELIQEKVIELFKIKTIQDFIANSYPIIVIDEFQDCGGNYLSIIKQLSYATNLLIATDPFQQLDNKESNFGQEWLKKSGAVIINLDGKIWRTNNSRILNTATSLRKGLKVSGNKIDIKVCPSHYISGALVKSSIYYSLLNGNNTAIISPVNASKSTFIKQSLEQLYTTHTFKSGKNKGKKIGPFGHLLSNFEKSDINKICLDIIGKDLSKKELLILKSHHHYIVRLCSNIALNKLSLRNMSFISANEFKSILDQTAHTYDNFIISDITSKLVFTTIHGAKNREYDNVIVLWPYEVSGDLLYRRKLMYNAITRARKSAIILIQHKNSNLVEIKNDDLFSMIID